MHSGVFANPLCPFQVAVDSFLFSYNNTAHCIVEYLFILHSAFCIVFVYAGARHAPSAQDNATGVLVPVRSVLPSGKVDYDPRVFGTSGNAHAKGDLAFTNEDGNLMYMSEDGE